MARHPFLEIRARLVTATVFSLAAGLYMILWDRSAVHQAGPALALLPLPGTVLLGVLFGPTLAVQARKGAPLWVAAIEGMAITVFAYLLGLVTLLVLSWDRRTPWTSPSTRSGWSTCSRRRSPWGPSSA